VQHDRTFMRPVDMPALVKVLHTEADIHMVSLLTRSTMGHTTRIWDRTRSGKGSTVGSSKMADADWKQRARSTTASPGAHAAVAGQHTSGKGAAHRALVSLVTSLRNVFAAFVFICSKVGASAMRVRGISGRCTALYRSLMGYVDFYISAVSAWTVTAQGYPDEVTITMLLQSAYIHRKRSWA
jgi:hypothetical protein